jgi:hypothetical protein
MNGFVFRLSPFIRSYYNYLRNMLRACRGGGGPDALLLVEKPGEGDSIGGYGLGAQKKLHLLSLSAVLVPSAAPELRLACTRRFEAAL